MPSKRTLFTPSSILFRPHHQNSDVLFAPSAGVLVVEAPGTAPGSEKLISTPIYHHSWQASPTNISICCAISKFLSSVRKVDNIAPV